MSVLLCLCSTLFNGPHLHVHIHGLFKIYFFLDDA